MSIRESPERKSRIPPSSPSHADPADEGRLSERRQRWHLLLGWAGLAIVVASGLFLEGLHAVKAELYLLPDNETRRLMWRLAHAHAGLLCLLHLGFAATLKIAPRAARAARALTWGSIALPAGFFLGGLGAEDGDPSLGILLVPLGAVLLLSAVVRVAWVLHRDA